MKDISESNMVGRAQNKESEYVRNKGTLAVKQGHYETERSKDS